MSFTHICCIVALIHSHGLSAIGDSTLISLYSKTVNTLASDSLHGRACCSPDEKKSAAYIAGEMSRSGAVVQYQKFSVHPKDSTHACEAVNVYCFTDNHKDSTILIGAHYDHLGYGGVLSKSFRKGIHHGADDNASGVALLLGLLHHYAAWADTNYNYLFVTYSAHEVGLYGSAAFAKKAGKKFGHLALVLNFDMVGHMDPDMRMIVLYGKSTLQSGSSFFDKNRCTCLFRSDGNERLNLLDTRSFYKQGIPCLSLTTGIHTDYHKISDTADKINYDGILLVQQVVESFFRYKQDAGR